MEATDRRAGRPPAPADMASRHHISLIMNMTRIWADIAGARAFLQLAYIADDL